MIKQKLYSCITIAALTTLLSASLIATAKVTEPPQVELLPEVVEIINAPAPTLEYLKQDIYSALLAMDSPEGSDFMEIGANIIMHNYEAREIGLKSGSYDQWLAAHAVRSNSSTFHDENAKMMINRNDDAKIYTLPCSNFVVYPTERNCVKKTIEDKRVIESLVISNKIFIERYLQIIELPHFGDYLFGSSDSIPPFQNLTFIGDLRLAQAIIAFDEGQADKGFALLKSEIDFRKRMLSAQTGLMSKMLGVNQTLKAYNVLSHLMGEPEFSNYLNDKRVGDLLTSLTLEEQIGLATAIAYERNNQIFEAIILGDGFEVKHLAQVEAGLKEFLGPYYDELRVSDTAALEELLQNESASHNGNVSANALYLMFQEAINHASLSIDEASKLYIANKGLMTHAEVQNVLLEQYKKGAEQYGKDFNLIGFYLLKGASADFEEYQLRVYDLQAYIYLVQVKHQMLMEGVKKEDAAAFLLKMNARNPYTQERLEWNADTGSLNTFWLNNKTAASGGAVQMSMPVFTHP